MTSVADCRSCVAKDRCGLYSIQLACGGAAPAVQECLYDSGAALLTQAEPSTRLYAVKVGAVLLHRDPPQGERRAVAVVGQGTVLGAGAMLSAGALAHAQTYTSTRVCEMRVDPVGLFLARQPQLVIELGRAVVRLSDAFLQWSALARLPDAQQRLHLVLRLIMQAQGSRVIDLPSRHDLAQLCGCVPETVSRALSQAVSAGQLQRLGRHRVEWVGEG